MDLWNIELVQHDLWQNNSGENNFSGENSRIFGDVV